MALAVPSTIIGKKIIGRKIQPIIDIYSEKNKSLIRN